MVPSLPLEQPQTAFLRPGAALNQKAEDKTAGEVYHLSDYFARGCTAGLRFRQTDIPKPKQEKESAMDGDWNLRGCDRNDPNRLKSPEEAAELIRRIGFLPLFSVGIPGFSLEERVPAWDWWSDDPSRDPWIWRMILAEYDDIAYGKFFDRKAGFISKQWFPAFANYRRDGYDYEGLHEDGKMKGGAWKILNTLKLDEYAVGAEMMSGQLRKAARVEKGFDGLLIELQMQSFLLISRFRQKMNKKGIAYGWHLPSFMTPETKWGYDFVNSEDVKPEQSCLKMAEQIALYFPEADQKTIKKIIKR